MKSKRLKFFLITIIFCIIISIVMVEKFKSTNEKKLKKYAITETSHFISNLIQQIVYDVSNNKLDDNKIFSISRNNYNEIEIIDFNTKEVNNVLEEITTKIEENLKMLEQGKIKNLNISSTFKGKNFKGIHDGVLFELGDNFFGNKVFNIETKIPLRISFIGNVYTSISTKIKNYGLNSAYLEVIVKVEVKEKIVMPTTNTECVIKDDYPIALKIIQGKIPNYYNGEFESNSTTYSLPLKK